MQNDANFWLPKLSGRSLLLRPLVDADFEGLFAVASDARLWEQHSEKDRYQRPVFKKFFEKAVHPPSALVVIDKASGEIIGSSRFYDFNPDESSVVVGYTFLAKKCWGGLVNAELKQLMLDYAFRKVDNVFFQASENNLRSQRAIERLGAERKPGVFDLPGIGPRVVYHLSKEKWRHMEERSKQ